jgi:hypothetical protein
MAMRRNLFMIIDIRDSDSQKGFKMPIPIFVLGNALEAADDLINLLSLFLPHKMKKLLNIHGLEIPNLVGAAFAAIEEIRECGSFMLVEVQDANGAGVRIRLI